MDVACQVSHSHLHIAACDSGIKIKKLFNQSRPEEHITLF